MNQEYSPGDRIRMVQMAPDPLPIEPGSLGTITRVQQGLYFSLQIDVKWDNGRSLSVILPDDKIELVDPVTP